MSPLKLIVFDLDYTLWPFWVDTHVRGPFKIRNDQVVDGSGQKIKFYPEVPAILESLKSKGYILGIASRTEWPEGARKLLLLFGWSEYFTHQEIYPGRKTTNFKKIKDASGVQYSDMLFFDDEVRNITDLTAIGVKSILVRDGVNMKMVEEAIKSFK
ncbi:hypothetical protein JTE90_005058 [Oedothorax gibbosus]|uniref:Magnesium-dependent phosphatase 1 n=1 Tax=Oedothorax gibbosus TaxID=931172 RepID=A0AAV6VBA9_9ARAC|nr:hypothetical protein JTE90_005058 [Oedothorax gibbosus]